ncbi:FecR family protein [Chitinophaga pinensis]|uniref:Anti-FecI sigma factor, FecR n=1 Tax=Chitinophaga pinensis (strain ATCC 43595 / DSM 2588 / LMG 13176 / NBRC 15968 / NCIMB 11800 / UQM 2034) TaxID=485918 RepID=A0A979G6V8_CHIPD|nr:FecR family protein [Chitinophaga pinensis]ACU61989.1 anti-FecI sigma factor, FecR [Chitinophaga pinensis DSM 2588]
MTREELLLLTEKIASGTATDEELMQFNRLFDAFRLAAEWDETLLGNRQMIGDTIRERIQVVIERPAVRIVPWRRWMIAASIAVLLSGGYFYYRTLQHPVLAPQAERFKNDVAAPAGHHAVLTLSNGTKILLDSAGKGTLAMQGSINVSMNANGQIVYNGEDNTNATNTIEVPPGSQPLAIVLSDGTKVWIDAASTLTYPTAFSGNDRTVNIIGQAYFEVAPNSRKPFKVKNGIDQSTIEVLGTSFNIKAFGPDKQTETNLFSGAVAISTTNARQLLHPGERAVVNNEGAIQITTGADMKEVLAWKEGIFYFNGKDIPAIMTELQRYYDIEVEYQTNVNDEFIASIPRDVPVSQLLNLLEMTNLVHFRIEGRKVIVIR